ncbi:hypothetical protein H257_03597 [Aphanomyces astaci]|uniref:Uncharacterized protein n=1 Tax=Aphanomyces astaci TaxID=112090 RepID=W4GYG0_APHAT|nr:hypothetical protein H257_03597 [Aphanomyces astaci]ETV84366.1 hypothetical protein H257_03597 [Aphanomyces astaci]|eukprot:XP_009826058.1 hypothetical protein H257_03597 [Aphanomyces astaci]
MPPAATTQAAVASSDIVTLRVAGKDYNITSAFNSARRSVSGLMSCNSRTLAELPSAKTIKQSKRLWQAAELANAGFMVEFFATADQVTALTCIEYRGHNQETPFLVACRLGHVQCVSILMQHGANRHAVDHHGNTGLHHACRQGHVALVQFLSAHMDVYIHNAKRLSAIDLCRQQLHGQQHNANMARCMECLENRVKLFEGWIEVSEPSVGSVLTGLSLLQAWQLRYVVVYGVGSTTYVDVAVYSIAHELRPLLPTNVFVVPVHQLVSFNLQPKLFQPRPYTFALHGSPKRKDMYIGVSQTVEFAASNPQEFERWTTFFCVTLLNDRVVDEGGAGMLSNTSAHSSPTDGSTSLPFRPGRIIEIEK